MYKLAFLTVCIALVTIGCAQQKQVSTSGSVETKAPNTSYSPAFIGQTRINKVSTSTPWTHKVLATGIGKPWAVIELNNAQLLITDKTGFMQVYDRSGQLVKKINGFPKVDSRGQGGMLDVILDPGFASNQIIYWAYSHPYPQGKNLTAVAKGRLNVEAGTIENPMVIFEANPQFPSDKHYGCRLLIDHNGYLLVSTGERSDVPGRIQAQDLSSGLGKIFRITTDGKPAPGNPFIGRPDAMPEIYASGIRNAQGMAFHPVTGEIWETEFGPRGGDEINIIKAGKDYGWPTISYGIEYGGGKIGQGITQKPGLEQPIYYWDPVISPSGIDFYRAATIPEWQNNLFIACLSGQHIARVVISDNKVTGEERLLEGERERFRDLVTTADGKIYAVTDSGKIYVVEKK